MALSQTDKDRIVAEVLTNIEAAAFRRMCEDAAVQIYQNGDVRTKDAEAALKSMLIQAAPMMPGRSP